MKSAAITQRVKFGNQVSMILDCVHGRRRPRRYNGNSSAVAELSEFNSHKNAHNQVS
jgi:hypothetical protein